MRLYVLSVGASEVIRFDCSSCRNKERECFLSKSCDDKIVLSRKSVNI
jgi:hypothetical protein